MTITSKQSKTIAIFTTIFLFFHFPYIYQLTKHANEHKVLENENVNSSVFNEAEQMTARKRTSQANDNGGDGDNGDASTKEQIERISDAASGCYEDVVLRPKSEQNNNRRLVRPFAVFSGLFKSHRKSRDVNQEENVTENSAKFLSSCVIVDNKDIKIKPKKKSWNIFKSKKKTQRDSSPSFQHFQEPLNVERVSLPIGPYVDKYNDAEWYDLNREEMSLFEARVSDIVNEFNQNSSQIVCDSETESLYLCDLSRYFTISTNISQNILWSHNLSVECQSNSNPSHISHINLLGANNNRDQIHSDVFIENEEEDIVVDDQTENTKLCGSFNKRLNSSFASIDSDGYTVMQPILQLSQKKYPVEPTVLIDNTMTTKPTTATDYCYNYNSDDFSNLSSGFGSDSDGGGCSSPHERQQSMAFAFAVASPATSDFSEAFPSPALTTNTTPLTTANSTQKTKKCQSLRIRSRKLLSILYAKQMPSNVTTTQQNKSSPECIQQKKMFKGTPFKVHFKKMEGEMVVVKANDVSKKSQHLLH